MNKEYNYDNVYMIPQKCIVNSRSDCDISVKLGDYTFRNPVIAANMKSVVDEKTCEYLVGKNMFYIMHRFGTNQQEFIALMHKKNHYASISLGVKESDKNLVNDFKAKDLIPEFITIDIAHGHADSVINMIKHIKNVLPDTFVIAGNVATGIAVTELEEAGADCTKIFVGPGAACTSKLKTGFTRGTVSCLQECSLVAKKPLIADGGIRHCGDIAKAMASGATMVMAGSFMAGYDQNSGKIVQINGHKKYIYYGSASYNNKGHKKHIEGTEIILDYKSNMDDHIEDIDYSLKSSVSYAGKNKILDIHSTSVFYF